MGGKKKEIPTLVKQIFVTSNVTMMLFIYRQAAFCRCWYLWMEDSLPVTCNLSSANMRLLTLVMTTSGEGDFWGFFFWGGRGGVTFFSLGATQMPVPLKPGLLEIHLC